MILIFFKYLLKLLIMKGGKVTFVLFMSFVQKDTNAKKKKGKTPGGAFP
jgi:hypothetical protein